MHTTSPNHHAGQGSFGGVAGLAAGLTMVFGRNGDARWAMELTGAGPDDRIVDVGCGPGAAARHTARAGLTVTGVDPSAAMLRLARRLTHGVTVSYLEHGFAGTRVEQRRVGRRRRLIGVAASAPT
jgi:SAM-dependent methyltransferase